MSPCARCLAGNPTVEVAGLRFHALSDRWISCVGAEQPGASVPARREFVVRIENAYRAICVSNFVRLRRQFYPGKSLASGRAAQ